MGSQRISALILGLSTCVALSACQTTQSSVPASNIDSAMARAANYGQTSSKSVSYLERVYKKNPDDVKAATDYARGLRNADKLDRAGVILEPFAKKKDAPSFVTSEYAAIHLAEGDYEAAEKYAQKAVISDENNYRAYHRLGIALDAQGMHKEGERAYRKGLELWQGDPTTIMNNLALNLASQGYLGESIEILHKAQSVAPGRVEIERNLRIVTALQQADGVPAPRPGKKPDVIAPN